MPALTTALGLSPPPIARPKQRALIQLRDEQKQLIDFRDTERTDRMRRHLMDINEAIRRLIVELSAQIGERQGDLLRLGDGCFNIRNISLFRIFNIDFRHGGRFYGHWTQSLPEGASEEADD